MRRGDPERIYQAQRAGFVEGAVTRREATRERVTAVLDALEAESEALGLERGSPEFWREAERRATGAHGAALRHIDVTRRPAHGYGETGPPRWARLRPERVP